MKPFYLYIFYIYSYLISKHETFTSPFIFFLYRMACKNPHDLAVWKGNTRWRHRTLTPWKRCSNVNIIMDARCPFKNRYIANIIAILLFLNILKRSGVSLRYPVLCHMVYLYPVFWFHHQQQLLSFRNIIGPLLFQTKIQANFLRPFHSVMAPCP